MVIFRKRLKEIRKQRNLTQEALGKGIYISKNEVCAYERGTRCPPLETLIRIADFLEVDFLWLIGRELDCMVGEDRIVNLSEEDIKIIQELRKNDELYERFLENPERTIKQLNNK